MAAPIAEAMHDNRITSIGQLELSSFDDLKGGLLNYMRHNEGFYLDTASSLNKIDKTKNAGNGAKWVDIHKKELNELIELYKQLSRETTSFIHSPWSHIEGQGVYKPTTSKAIGVHLEKSTAFSRTQRNSIYKQALNTLENLEDTPVVTKAIPMLTELIAEVDHGKRINLYNSFVEHIYNKGLLGDSLRDFANTLNYTNVNNGFVYSTEAEDTRSKINKRIKDLLSKTHGADFNDALKLYAAQPLDLKASKSGLYLWRIEDKETSSIKISLRNDPDSKETKIMKIYFDPETKKSNIQVSVVFNDDHMVQDSRKVSIKYDKDGKYIPAAKDRFLSSFILTETKRLELIKLYGEKYVANLQISELPKGTLVILADDFFNNGEVAALQSDYRTGSIYSGETVTEALKNISAQSLENDAKAGNIGEKIVNAYNKKRLQHSIDTQIMDQLFKTDRVRIVSIGSTGLDGNGGRASTSLLAKELGLSGNRINTFVNWKGDFFTELSSKGPLIDAESGAKILDSQATLSSKGNAKTGYLHQRRSVEYQPEMKALIENLTDKELALFNNRINTMLSKAKDSKIPYHEFTRTRFYFTKAWLNDAKSRHNIMNILLDLVNEGKIGKEYNLLTKKEQDKLYKGKNWIEQVKAKNADKNITAKNFSQFKWKPFSFDFPLIFQQEYKTNTYKLLQNSANSQAHFGVMMTDTSYYSSSWTANKLMADEENSRHIGSFREIKKGTKINIVPFNTAARGGSVNIKFVDESLNTTNTIEKGDIKGAEKYLTAVDIKKLEGKDSNIIRKFILNGLDKLDETLEFGHVIKYQVRQWGTLPYAQTIEHTILYTFRDKEANALFLAKANAPVNGPAYWRYLYEFELKDPKLLAEFGSFNVRSMMKGWMNSIVKSDRLWKLFLYSNITEQGMKGLVHQKGVRIYRGINISFGMPKVFAYLNFETFNAYWLNKRAAARIVHQTVNIYQFELNALKELIEKLSRGKKWDDMQYMSRLFTDAWMRAQPPDVQAAIRHLKVLLKSTNIKGIGNNTKLYTVLTQGKVANIKNVVSGSKYWHLVEEALLEAKAKAAAMRTALKYASAGDKAKFALANKIEFDFKTGQVWGIDIHGAKHAIEVAGKGIQLLKGLIITGKLNKVIAVMFISGASFSVMGAWETAQSNPSWANNAAYGEVLFDEIGDAWWVETVADMLAKISEIEFDFDFKELQKWWTAATSKIQTILQTFTDAHKAVFDPIMKILNQSPIYTSLEDFIIWLISVAWQITKFLANTVWDYVLSPILLTLVWVLQWIDPIFLAIGILFDEITNVFASGKKEVQGWYNALDDYDGTLAYINNDTFIGDVKNYGEAVFFAFDNAKYWCAQNPKECAAAEAEYEIRVKETKKNRAKYKKNFKLERINVFDVLDSNVDNI